MYYSYYYAINRCNVYGPALPLAEPSTTVAYDCQFSCVFHDVPVSTKMENSGEAHWPCKVKPGVWCVCLIITTSRDKRIHKLIDNSIIMI